jgi:AcrR family transcriptional regulator
MAAKRPKPRVRRSPEEARTHILDAADAVFRDHLPDAVGLREIAVAAGVSHGLVTHYFATYENLVAAVLSRRLEAARSAAFAHLAQMTFTADEAPLLSSSPSPFASSFLPAEYCVLPRLKRPGI